MKRLIPVCFVVVIALLVAIYSYRSLFVTETDVTRARVVLPVVDSGELPDDENSHGDGYDMESLITLASGETLITAVTLDIDDDGYDDQVNVVKTTHSPYLTLVIALYNAAAMRYDRTMSLPTTISQVRGFSCTAMDVIGNHRNAIIYQGIAENGHSVLLIYSGSRSERGTFSLTLIGDFEADGTIFIQQLDRGEAYELSQAHGASFPVWVYTSEMSDGATVFDQVQTRYEWSEAEQQYVQMAQQRIPGSSIAEKELSRIQDGTVATFGRFLDGLWYKTEHTAGDNCYIFFDYSNAELIFHQGDSEEVYSWQNSNLRRNGMYFSSVNKSIENLQRRVDISLVSLNEIRVRIQDDVRMIIGESTLWDGDYRKMTAVAHVTTMPDSEAIQTLVGGVTWVSSDGARIRFDEAAYTVTGANVADNGRYMQLVVSGETLLQFRSNTDTPFFAGMYSVRYAKLKNGTQETDDTATVQLHPVSVNPAGFYRKEARPVTLRLVPSEQ